MTSRVGSKMKIVSWEAFHSMFEHASAYLSLFETLKNAWQAWNPDCGGSRPIIDIYPDADNRVVVVDNGTGVPYSEIRKRIGNFGHTSKKAGAEEGQNLGWGASITLSFQNRERGATFTTWTKGSKQAAQCLISLDGEGAPSLIKYGKTEDDVHQVAKPINTPSGTMVSIGDLEFDPDLLDFEISSRFPRFLSNGASAEAEIRLHDSNPFAKGYKGTPKIVRPIAHRARAGESSTVREELGLPTSGHFETPHALVDWYILESPPSNLAHCIEAWNGEVYETYYGSGFVSTMSAYGVWAAHDRIVLLVNRRNPPGEPQIVTDLLRNETKNWARAKAMAECKAIICAPEHPLFQFMDWWSSKEEDNSTDDSGVRRILDAWKPPEPKLLGPGGKKKDEDSEGDEDTTPPGGNNSSGGGGSSSNSDDDEGKKKPRRRRSVQDQNGDTKVLAPPRTMMVGRNDMGSDPVRYIPDRNVIKINREVGEVQQLIEEARQKPQRSQKRVIDLIKAHMVHAVLTFNHKTGRVPGQEGDEYSLLMAISCPTAAISYVRGTNPARK